MPDAATLLDAFPYDFLWMVAGVFVLGAGNLTFPYLRQSFHKWRLGRRRAQSAFMLEEELREYERAIGEELEPLDWASKIAPVAAYSILSLLPVWASKAGLEGWWLAASFAVFALGAVYSMWRRVNDPDGKPFTFTGPEADIPTEAIAGLLIALVMVSLIILALLMF